MTATYLLLRGPDHVVLGLSWRNFVPVAGATGPAIKAGPDAICTLTFPPQHIAEQTVGDKPPDAFGSGDHLAARLAAPSHVAFAVPVGVEVALTVEGVLAALSAASVLPGAEHDPLNPQEFPGIDAGRPGPTAIELPWRLVMSPEPRGGAGQVVCTHDSAAPSGAATALWRTRLRAAAAAAPDAGLALRAIDHATAQLPDPPFTPALPGFRRAQIHNHAAVLPAPAERLELSSLGGSLTVLANWADLSWEHRAHLGRDVRVRTSSKCVLYPFGHRAEYIELTERVYEPWDPAVMALKQTRRLVITEPVRRQAADPRLARAFPFTEVEITEHVVENLDSPRVVSIIRPTEDQNTLFALQSQKEAELPEALQQGIDELYGPGHTASEFAPATTEEILRIGEFDENGPIPLVPGAARWLALTEELEIIQGLIDGTEGQEVSAFFWPARGGAPYTFPVRLAGTQGDLRITVPLMVVFDETVFEELGMPEFHTLSAPEVRRLLDDTWVGAKAGEVPLPSVPIDLIGAGASTDVHQVQQLNLVGFSHQGAFVPTLGPLSEALVTEITGLVGDEATALMSTAANWTTAVSLPVVRALQGSEARTLISYADRFLSAGPVEDLALRVAQDAPQIGIDFVGKTLGSGGLIAPQLQADAISRAHGLVQSAAFLAGGGLDPMKLMGDGAALLGFKLTDLIKTSGVSKPPTITQALVDGSPPEVRMEWTDIPLESFPPFVSRGSKLTMRVVNKWPDTTTTCSVTAFQLDLPGFGPKLLELGFDSLEFVHRPGQEPTLNVGKVSATFTGLLELVRDLQEKVKLGDAGPQVDVGTSGVVARYKLPVPPAACGAFVLRNIVFAAAIEVPFDGRPTSMTLAFADRANPFNLSVLMFGGGGYLELAVDSRGLQRLEASLEFGASVAVSFGIASAEVHAMGGVRYLMDERGIQLTGFLRIGGSVDLLGLISVSVELRLELTYDITGNRMVGRATLVVEIDLTFWSDSVELDSGEWEFVGGGSPVMLALPVPPTGLRDEFGAVDPAAALTVRRVFDEPPVETWRQYRKAFAGVGP